MATVTATPKSVRPHVQVVQFEDMETGYRYWSEPIEGSLNINQFLMEQEGRGQALSDLCHSIKCWCGGNDS